MNKGYARLVTKINDSFFKKMYVYEVYPLFNKNKYIAVSAIKKPIRETMIFPSDEDKPKNFIELWKSSECLKIKNVLDLLDYKETLDDPKYLFEYQKALNKLNKEQDKNYPRLKFLPKGENNG